MTSQRVIERLENHALLFKSVFLLGIAAILFFIFYELLEILILDYYPSPSNELILFVKTLMFFLVFCSFTLNMIIIGKVLGGGE